MIQTEDGGSLTGAPRHVGLILPDLAGGGAQRAFLSLSERLIDRGHKVDLILERADLDYLMHIPKGTRLYIQSIIGRLDGEMIRRCRTRGIPVKTLTVNPIGALLSWRFLRRNLPSPPTPRRRHVLYAHSIAKYARKHQPDLLLSALPDANASSVYAVEMLKRSVPLCISIHNNMTRSYVGDRLRTARALYHRADAVVAVSNGLGINVGRSLGIDPESIHVIYNPVDVSGVYRLSQEPIAHPWFADGEAPVILTVGRESASKDYETLVRAFCVVHRKMRTRLIVVGKFSDSYRRTLSSLADGASKDMEFVDFDENPFRYMRKAGLFVLSSRWEGLSIVLVEALACGTPIVSTDTPFGPREVLGDGKWGKLVAVGDAPAIACAMIETLQGDHPPEEALRRRAATFSSDRATDAYLDMFQEVMK